MLTLPLIFKNGHLFVKLEDGMWLFDTGAQISYFQDDSLAAFPAAGSITDFYPDVGQFQTDIHQVEVTPGETSFMLSCGILPGLLGATLMMAGTQGIQVLTNRIVGYFSRRSASFCERSVTFLMGRC